MLRHSASVKLNALPCRMSTLAGPRPRGGSKQAAARSPCGAKVGLEMAPQAIEKIDSAPENGAACDDEGGAGEIRMTAPDGTTKARAAATRVARESYGKLVAFLAAPGRDVPGAEDALADAFAAALTVWPAQGVPDNPEGWLARTARRRMIDASRRRRNAEAASDALAL